MKKYIIIVFLGVLMALPAKAATSVYGFMNGNFYDANQSLKYACLGDGNCWDYSANQITTLSAILGLASGQASTITITTPESTNIPVVPAAPVTSLPVNPTPAPAPTPPPTPAPVVTPPVLLSAYTEQQLEEKLGVWHNGCELSSSVCKVYDFPASCYADSDNPTQAFCNGVTGIQFKFNGQIVANTYATITDPDGTIEHNTLPAINGLTPNTDYSYQIIYHEDGREDTVLTKSFHTPSN